VSRVLLVCPEPLGHGQPAGIGIRFLEMARVLAKDGHALTVASPDAGAVPDARAVALTPANLGIESRQHDVAVLQGHVAGAFFDQAPDIPVVVDLYDPFIIENFHYYGERGAEVFLHDHAVLLRSIREGDVFLCASRAQRLFYAGVLLAAGRLNPASFANDPALDALLPIAPFGVHPPRGLEPRDLSAPAILFGGVYDWYDPILAIEAVALVRQSIPGTTLMFTRHPNPDITPQGELARAITHASTRGYDFVHFEPWAPYADRAAFYERHALALLTFPQSVETDLSMRTRVYDYLWSGLPIVTSSAPGTDEILSRYDAGSVVRSNAVEDFARELVAILGTRERYEALARGTQRFVHEHQWEQSLLPLRRFCGRPQRDPGRHAFTTASTGGGSLDLSPRPVSLLRRLKRRLRA
jgi:glycosyltransferase involved in cell wall biosynthesis